MHKNVIDTNDFMLPRVLGELNETQSDYDSLELQINEKHIDDIDNVLDKFTRVISLSNQTNYPFSVKTKREKPKRLSPKITNFRVVYSS